MLVAPPGALKSTMIELALAPYANALSITDININTLVKMRDDLTSGRYATIGFTEFEKLYQRSQTTAMNIEGSIKALVEEGFIRASFEDARMGGFRARCCVIGGMTPSFYASHFDSWQRSGFARRFLWAQYSVNNSHVIMEAIHQWKKINLDGIPRRYPGSDEIEFHVSVDESRLLQALVKEQAGESTPYVMLKKIFSCLRWKHGKDRKAPMRIVQDFAPCLTKDGGELFLPTSVKSKGKK